MDNIAQLTLPLEARHILNSLINQAAEHVPRVNINRAQRYQGGTVQTLQWFVDLYNQVCQLGLLLFPLNLHGSPTTPQIHRQSCNLKQRLQQCEQLSRTMYSEAVSSPYLKGILISILEFLKGLIDLLGEERTRHDNGILS